LHFVVFFWRLSFHDTSYVQALPRVRIYLLRRITRGPKTETSHLDQTKTLPNMIMMMLVLSSVPFGIGTTFCTFLRLTFFPSFPSLTYNFPHPPQSTH
jgi:hypothetical protein